jgi:hypothetical protein
VKNEKATRVDTAEFSFKHEGNKIQYSFNLERLEKLSRIENNIKLNKLNAVYDILTEEQTILRKRNTILKIADHHGWDTGKEYLDSPSADDKEDLRAAISRANCKRSTPKPYNRPDNQYGSVNRGSGSVKFNPRSFFRGFGQFNGAGFNSETSSVQTVGRCFYCIQQGHFARTCPHKGIATATAPKAQDGEDTVKIQLKEIFQLQIIKLCIILTLLKNIKNNLTRVL